MSARSEMYRLTREVENVHGTLPPFETGVTLLRSANMDVWKDSNAQVLWRGLLPRKQRERRLGRRRRADVVPATTAERVQREQPDRSERWPTLSLRFQGTTITRATAGPSSSDYTGGKSVDMIRKDIDTKTTSLV